MRPLSIVFLLIAFLLSGVDDGNASPLIKELKARRAAIDDVLKKQEAYEAADGMIKANPKGPNPSNPALIALIEKENLSREALFQEISDSSPSYPDAVSVGQWFARKYFERYRDGILREDPDLGGIVSKWPLDRKDANTLLRDFFSEIDAEKSQLEIAPIK